MLQMKSFSLFQTDAFYPFVRAITFNQQLLSLTLNESVRGANELIFPEHFKGLIKFKWNAGRDGKQQATLGADSLKQVKTLLPKVPLVIGEAKPI